MPRSMTSGVDALRGYITPRAPISLNLRHMSMHSLLASYAFISLLLLPSHVLCLISQSLETGCVPLKKCCHDTIIAMDPASAFGLACNVLYVAELGVKIIRSYQRVYRESVADTNLVELTKSFAIAHSSLNQHLHSPGIHLALNQSDTELHNLTVKCHDVAATLSHELDKLTITDSTSGKRRQAFIISLKTIWKTGLMHELKARLQGYREAVRDFVILEQR